MSLPSVDSAFALFNGRVAFCKSHWILLFQTAFKFSGNFWLSW